MFIIAISGLFIKFFQDEMLQELQELCTRSRDTKPFGEKQFVGVSTGSADSHSKAERCAACLFYTPYQGEGESAPRHVACGSCWCPVGSTRMLVMF